LSTATPDGAPLSSARAPRSWPFAAALVAFVVLLGLLPHLRFSLLIGEPTFFISAYDEPAYALWAFEGGGPVLPHRWLSSLVMVALSRLGGGGWGTALVLADAVLPTLCALFAWQLVGYVTRRRLLRLLLAIMLLFAQELFSLGCWTIWQVRDPLAVASPTSGPFDLRQLRAEAPPWLAALWPDYATPFLTLFRTPEPQLSLVVLYWLLAILLELGDDALAPRRRQLLVAVGGALNLLLVGTYFFTASALVAVETALAGTLAVWGRSNSARLVGALAATGAASTIAGVVAFHSGANAQGYSFASRLPILTPSTLTAALGLLILVALRRKPGTLERGLPLAAACFAAVLMLTNQQLLTGRMISTRDWERSIDYRLAFLGAALLGACLLRRTTVRLEALYALAGAGLLATGAVLLRAQDRVFEEEFLGVNLKSVALARAMRIAETAGFRDARVLLEEPQLDLILEVRLERRIQHLLDVSPVFERPIDPLDRKDGRFGRRSPFTREAFEYLARRPRSGKGVERLLRAEVEQGAGILLRFFFDPRDFWNVFTDGRRARPADVAAELAGIRADYEDYLTAGDPCWALPVVVLSRQSAVERESPSWHERLLAEVTVGREPTLMNMHAYLQLPAASKASPADSPPGGSACR
jgi:hypothetical protein